MRKWVVLGLVVILVVGIAVAIALRNLNTYLNENKAWLTGNAQAALGRPLNFGEIAVSLAGGLSVRLTDLRIGDDPAFSDGDFLRAQTVYVLVKILPAILGQYEVRRIVLENPEITVIHADQGFNFDSIGQPHDQKQPPRQNTTKPEAGADGPPPLLISNMTITDATIRFADRTATPPADMIIQQLDFSAQDVSLTTPIQLEITAAVLGARTRNIALSGTIGPIRPELPIDQLPMDLTVEFDPLVLDDLRRIPAVADALPADLSSPDPIRVRADLEGTLNQLGVTGSVNGTAAAIAYASVFNKPRGVPFEVELTARRADATLAIERLSVLLATLTSVTTGQLTTGATPLLDLQTEVTSTSLAGLERFLPSVADYDLTGTLQTNLSIAGRVQADRLPNLTGTLSVDNVGLKGAGAVPEIGALTAIINFTGNAADLQTKTFTVEGSPVELRATVDNFRRPTVNVVVTSSALHGAALGLSAGPDGTDILRDLAINATVHGGAALAFKGSVRSPAGRLYGMDYQDLRSDFALDDGVATLDRLEFRAFGGTYRGSGTYDRQAPDNPTFSFLSTVRALRLQPLLESQSVAAAQQIEGTLYTELALRGAGQKWPTIRDTLRGSGRLDVKEGMIKDVNLAEQVLNGVTGITGLTQLISPRVRSKYPGLFGVGDTVFEELGGTLRIADGRATTDDLRIAARDYAIDGSGTYTFDQQLDFNATFIASKQLTDDIVTDVREARFLADQQGRLEIPFVFTGTLHDLQVRPNLTFVAKVLQHALVQTGIEKLFGDTTPGKTPGTSTSPEKDLLQKGLDGLFGQ